MKKLIDADDLIAWAEIVPLTDDGGIDINDFEEKLKSMPTIDAEPHWIPCSERMPNDDKDYLVTDGESMAVGYYRTDAKAWDNVNFGWLEHREETCGLKMVIAWMPLPEPYEGDKE